MLPLEDVLGERLNVAVLRLLVSLQGGLSGNEIARRLGAHQSAVRKALERLVARGIISRTDLGRSASYELNRRQAMVSNVLVPLFTAEADLRRDLWKDLRAAVDKLKPRPATVIVYGSLAREAPAPRDIDLLVIVHRKADEEPLRLALLDAVGPLEAAFEVAVHPIVLTTAELRRRSREEFMRNIGKDGIVVFGVPPEPLRHLRRWQQPRSIEFP